MEKAALTCNYCFLLITCVLLFTGSFASKAPYIVLALLMLLVPILNVVVIKRGLHRNWMTLAIICNIVLFALFCWMFVSALQFDIRSGIHLKNKPRPVEIFMWLLFLSLPFSALVIARKQAKKRSGDANWLVCAVCPSTLQTTNSLLFHFV